MEKENILRSDLLDIIFENRNKDYGAYTLRKYYPERIYKSLGIIFLLISVLIVWSLLYKPTIILKGPDIDTVEGSIPKVPDAPKEKPVTPKTPQQPLQKDIASQLHVSIIRIVDSTEVADKLAKNLDSVAIGSVTNDGQNTNTQVVQVFSVGGNGTTNNTTAVTSTVDKNIPRYDVEVMPTYPGGTDALIKFLQRNLHNPRDLEEGEMVSVKIMFIVGYDGSLKGFKTIEDGGVEFNNEVIRVLKKMPSWVPGRSAGESVSVYYTIPVKFIPQE